MMCLELLSATLDNVLFVIVERDPFYVAQSLLKAREEVQGTRTIGWGAGAEETLVSASISPIEQVANQTRQLYEQLRRSREQLPEGGCIDVSYESFCGDPAGLVHVIGDRVWGTVPLSSDELGRR